MLLPAVQASREAARRTMCMQNLTQLGAALQNYEMAHEVYPPGTIDKQGPIQSVAQGDHRNWLIHICHILKRRTLIAHRSSGWRVRSENAAVRALRIGSIECPSEATDQSATPASNYAAVYNDVEAPIDVDNHGRVFSQQQIRRDEYFRRPSATHFSLAKS